MLFKPPENVLLVSAVGSELGDLTGHALGVGPIEAGLSMASLLGKTNPDAVIFLGSAGLYPGHDELQIGSVIVSERHHWRHAAQVTGDGYVPKPPQPIACAPHLVRATGLPAVDVVTVSAITTSPDIATQFSRTAPVEHMEAWAVARACEKVGVPMIAVLGLANIVGPQAHEQWLVHRAEAEKSAQAVVERMVRTGFDRSTD